MDRVLMRLRVHDLVTLGHDQRRATTLVHAAKPPGIKIQRAFSRCDAAVVAPVGDLGHEGRWDER